MFVSLKKYTDLMEKYHSVLDRLTERNNERDRLTAENAELRRRLDALRPKPPACAIDEPGGDEYEWLRWDESLARYIAIAEGRDNG